MNDSSRTCHTGFQNTPVASIATCVQPASVSHSASSRRPDVVVGNSRCSVATVRPAAARTHAFTRREWTSNPAHRRYRTSIVHLLIARRWRGVRRNEIYKTRLPAEPVSQCGVLAGLRVQLYDGLSAQGPTDLCASVTRYTLPRFHACAGPAAPGGELYGDTRVESKSSECARRHVSLSLVFPTPSHDRLPLPSSDLLACPTVPHRLLPSQAARTGTR